MKAEHTKAADEIRISEQEFSRIMSRALQVKPKARKPKRATARRKRSAK